MHQPHLSQVYLARTPILEKELRKNQLERPKNGELLIDKAQQKKTVKKEQESWLLKIKHLIRKEREGSLSMKIKIELILNSNR